ncbi:MAG: cyclic nucleotide-binding domain-containing protein [Betaproteobacteria bacterium]|jgi:signal-transduction protein with cAMP-binding, CBS, and nucleotidyltransferase domain
MYVITEEGEQIPMPIFKKLPFNLKKTVFRTTHMLTIKPDDVLFNEGDKGDGFYVLLFGKLQIYKNVNGQVTNLSEVKPGGFFGEMALIDEEPRAASVKAIIESKLVFFPSGAFHMTIKNDHTVAQGVAEYLCEVLNSAANPQYPSELKDQIIKGHIPSDIETLKKMVQAIRDSNVPADPSSEGSDEGHAE